MSDTWPPEEAEAVHLLDNEGPDGWGAPDGEPLPPIRLPALAEVAAAARSSHLLERVRRLAAWVGWERPLTSTEVLKRADAKAAVADLDLLPPADPRRNGVKSARDVPELHRLWVIAGDLEWIQFGVATTPKAAGRRPLPPEDDGEAMSEWYDALLALLDPGSEAEFHPDRPALEGRAAAGPGRPVRRNGTAGGDGTGRPHRRTGRAGDRAPVRIPVEPRPVRLPAGRGSRVRRLSHRRIRRPPDSWTIPAPRPLSAPWPTPTPSGRGS